jgi:hypothetical protein
MTQQRLDDGAEENEMNQTTLNNTNEDSETSASIKIGSVVWVLSIFHRHGEDISVYQTDKGALDALAAYCAEWWDNECSRNGEDRTRPDDDDDLIIQYFDGTDDESYEIRCLTLQP